MAKQIVCDRCGKILEPNGQKEVCILDDSCKAYDLCPSCYREFKQFLADGKGDKQ